jgi:hypothetical protein
LWRFFVVLRNVEKKERLLGMYGSRERSCLEGSQQETCSVPAWMARAIHPFDLEKRQEISRREVHENTLEQPTIEDEN